MDLVTLKEQKNRLNMVRLAFLLSSEVSGPGADELLSAVLCVCVCTQAWLCVHAPLQVMWNLIANRTWCQFEVRAFSAAEGFAGGLVLVECFSSLIACICSGFHVQRNFPLKPSVFQENHKILCESVCVCVSERETRGVERNRGALLTCYYTFEDCIVLVRIHKWGNAFTPQRSCESLSYPQFKKIKIKFWWSTQGLSYVATSCKQCSHHFNYWDLAKAASLKRSLMG